MQELSRTKESTPSWTSKSWSAWAPATPSQSTWCRSSTQGRARPFYAFTTEGRKTRAAREHPAVCFEVDEYDGDTGSWTSVILWGRYEELQGGARTEALAILSERHGARRPSTSPGASSSALRGIPSARPSPSASRSRGRRAAGSSGSPDRGGSPAPVATVFEAGAARTGAGLRARQSGSGRIGQKPMPDIHQALRDAGPRSGGHDGRAARLRLEYAWRRKWRPDRQGQDRVEAPRGQSAHCERRAVAVPRGSGLGDRRASRPDRRRNVLIAVVPGQPPMMPNTALGLLLVGGAGALCSRRHPGRMRLALSRLAALVVLAIGACASTVRAARTRNSAVGAPGRKPSSGATPGTWAMVPRGLIRACS